ncbi:hypothetical protein L2E82_50297 [Cichorium intybus]|nr:hypothetical protein L2E82_50297 [Cichorium intybus]
MGGRSNLYMICLLPVIPPLQQDLIISINFMFAELSRALAVRPLDTTRFYVASELCLVEPPPPYGSTHYALTHPYHTHIYTYTPPNPSPLFPSYLKHRFSAIT